MKKEGLIRALNYDDCSIQESTAAALEEIGDQRAKEPLKKYYADVAYAERLFYKGRPPHYPFC